MWALIPLKSFVNAKQRLSSVLSDDERSGLFLAMVNDVLSVLSTHPDIDNILIVSDDSDVEQLAQHYAAQWVTEKQLGVTGLNQAIKSGVDYLAERDVDEVLVIHGDLPLLSAIELSHLISTHEYNGFIVSQSTERTGVSSVITLAPDRHNEGTNGLICSTHSDFNFAYGEDSFTQHKLWAEENGMGVQIVNLPGLGADIDKPDDLLMLVQRASERNATCSYHFIKEKQLADRIMNAVDDQSLLVKAGQLAADANYSWGR